MDNHDFKAKVEGIERVQRFMLQSLYGQIDVLRGPWFDPPRTPARSALGGEPK
jgi:hypothetical protein